VLLAALNADDQCLVLTVLFVACNMELIDHATDNWSPSDSLAELSCPEGNQEGGSMASG
jgi:hypothetical protein